MEDVSKLADLIENAYDAGDDVAAPRVSHTEMMLFRAIMEATNRIVTLEERLSGVEKVTKSVESDLRWMPGGSKMNDEKLIDALIQSAYETGYYSGKHEDGQPHHRAAIMMRNKIRRQVLVRLAHLRAAATIFNTLPLPGGDHPPGAWHYRE